ncbi:Paraneoplastic antigen Ma1 [Merluccius polli]|uniref:Paraneoplastic antigen Ma1 n=1 Tax=Merluccius polli TaxID=89951 RepID=A0AA47M8P4_MERPO|nr:Paraneoplastic antigen Ma1 [Merluccius polli]
MDIFDKHEIKVPNSVMVEGMTNTVTDNKVFDFLKQYGSISKMVTIDEPDSPFDQTLIVEFSSGAAVSALQSFSPHFIYSGEPKVVYEISDLAIVCATQVGQATTKSYLTELQNLAKLTGRDFADVLNGAMSQIGLSVSKLQHVPTAEKEPQGGEEKPPPLVPSIPVSSASPPAAVATNTVPSLKEEATVQSPEVQHYVVEHIVKNEDNGFHHSAQRLRSFSGKIPRPQNETDYDTWRSGVDLLLQDPSVSDLHRSRRIFESLLPPAADMIKHLRPDTSPAIYLQTLDSAYGAVQDGDELYAKFIDTFQNTGEKPSMYLQRLQVALNMVVKRGGILEAEVSRHLLNQFCRGCWNDALIAQLQLKQRKLNPPSFSELLLLLRTEEDGEAAKALRMKQHLGPSKPKASAQAQYAVIDSEEKGVCAVLTTITQQLTKQLAEIQRQLATLTAAQVSSTKPAVPRATNGGRSGGGLRAGKANATPSARSQPSGPKPGYCFHCGEDGHIKLQCDNPPNPALVTMKRKEFAERQQRWRRSPDSTQHLN